MMSVISGHVKDFRALKTQITGIEQQLLMQCVTY